MDLLPCSALLLAQAEPAAPGDGGALGNPLFLFAIMAVFIYLVMIRPQRKEEQRKASLLSGLKKDDRVVTIGGIFGTIVNVKDDEVILRIDDQNKVRVRLLKQAVLRVVTEESSGGEPAADSKKS